MFRNTPQPYLERRYPHPSGASRVRFVTTQPRFKSSCRCTPAQGIRRNENVECNLEDIRPSLRKCGPHARYVRGAVRFLVDRDAETRLATICRPSLCDFHPAGVACHNEHNRLRLHGGKHETDEGARCTDTKERDNKSAAYICANAADGIRNGAFYAARRHNVHLPDTKRSSACCSP